MIRFYEKMVLICIVRAEGIWRVGKATAVPRSPSRERQILLLILALADFHAGLKIERWTLYKIIFKNLQNIFTDEWGRMERFRKAELRF